MRLRVKIDAIDTANRHAGQQNITAVLNAVDTTKPRRQLVAAGRTGATLAVRRDNEQCRQHQDTRTDKQRAYTRGSLLSKPFSLGTKVHSLRSPVAGFPPLSVCPGGR